MPTNKPRALTHETTEAAVELALERLREQPGVARVDGRDKNSAGFYRVEWQGLSHPGHGLVVNTRNYDRYVGIARRAIAAANHKPVKKPAARAGRVLPSEVKRRK